MYALDDDAEPQWRMPPRCDSVCDCCGRPCCRGDEPGVDVLCGACRAEFGYPRLDANVRVEP